MARIPKPVNRKPAVDPDMSESSPHRPPAIAGGLKA